MSSVASASLLIFAPVNRYLRAPRGALLCVYATWLLAACRVEGVPSAGRCAVAALLPLRRFFGIDPWLGCGGSSREVELMAWIGRAITGPDLHQLPAGGDRLPGGLACSTAWLTDTAAVRSSRTSTRSNWATTSSR